MFFVIQRIDTKTGDEKAPVASSWGVVSMHDTQDDAETKASEVAKTAPGTFFVAEALTTLEVTLTMKSLAKR